MDIKTEPNEDTSSENTDNGKILDVKLEQYQVLIYSSSK